MNNQTQKTLNQPDIQIRCAVCSTTLDHIEEHITGPRLMAHESPYAIQASFTPTSLRYRCKCLMSYHIDLLNILNTVKTARAQQRHIIWIGRNPKQYRPHALR